MGIPSRAFAPQASVAASGVRDDGCHDSTCFIRWGEDECLHGRFLYSSYTPSARACCSPLGLTVRMSWWRNLASDGHRESGCVRSEYRHVTLPTDDTPPS